MFERIPNRLLVVPTLLSVVVVVGACSASPSNDVAEEGSERSTPQSPPLSPGYHGEIWGGFVFRDPAGTPLSYATSPPASGPVPGAEGIPEGHPGFTQFASVDEARAILPASTETFEVTVIPPQYEFSGGWAIVLDGGRVVDLSLSYRLRGTTFGPLTPALWIGWTDRAPKPLPASTVENVLPTGSVGAPVLKLTVRNQPGVYQAWSNPTTTPPESKVRSSINWFEGGRLWFVQGTEEAGTLFAIAQSIQTQR